MDRHYSDACDACIARHIGPALEHVIGTSNRPYCGGCGRCSGQVRVRRFSYWFPWEHTC